MPFMSALLESIAQIKDFDDSDRECQRVVEGNTSMNAVSSTISRDYCLMMIWSVFRVCTVVSQCFEI